MIIREAVMEELTPVMEFYNMMCGELGKASFLPEGDKGGFPSEEMVRTSIENRELWVGEEDGSIVAAYFMNHEADEAYDSVKWQRELPKDQVYILHGLRVSPACSGRGYAKRLVEHAIQTAEGRGQKAIRLDCIEGNDVPQKMYRSYGFCQMGTVEICYADIGVPRKFQVYELLL